jgi:hypothetical protein
LDQNYPKKDRKNITELNINPYRNFFSEEKKLIGSLRLEDFINLKELNCGGNLITNLDLSDCRSLETLDCYSNKLSNLELKNLFRINRIDCSFNQINKLSIFNCPKISSLSAHNNILTNLDFLNTVNPKKIIYLNINDNNFPEQDLSVFSKFVNLKDLLIGNDKEGKNQQENINRFYGSLKFLRNIDKLELLDISNTNIDSGLEYLPDSLEKVFCKASGRSSSNEIHTFLKPFGT